MTNAYWSQWSSEELDRMQGKDWARHEGVLEDLDIDIEVPESEEEDEQPSLELYGMSWRDFM